MNVLIKTGLSNRVLDLRLAADMQNNSVHVCSDQRTYNNSHYVSARFNTEPVSVSLLVQV